MRIEPMHFYLWSGLSLIGGSVFGWVDGLPTATALLLISFGIILSRIDTQRKDDE